MYTRQTCQSGFVQQIMSKYLYTTQGYNDILETWMVVCLTATKF